MKDFVIITDSTCDLSKEIRAKYGIDYVKMNIVRNSQELPASLDWDVYTAKELYGWMRDGEVIKTTQVPVMEYMNVFIKYLKQKKDILYIGCSSALSGSVNISYIVRGDLLKKFPDAKIICIDSLNGSMGQGLMVMKAASMKEEGKSFEEISEHIEKHKLCFHQVGTTETLEYLKKAGRIKATSAFFGNILGVKPIIISDIKGNNFAFKKVKGRQKSLDELINIVKKEIEDPQNQTIAILHADCDNDFEYVKIKIEQEISCKEIIINDIGPIIGASTGPGTIAIYFYGKEITILGE